MTNHRWYFLIQKEGETKWHSLNSSLALSEGNYRLAAKSDRPHLDLAIRLIYAAIASEKTDSDPIVQNYKGRVNSQGFVFLSPVIYFSSGNWQICCQPLASETVSDSRWQITLDFEITAKEKVAAIAPNLENSPFHQSLLDIKLPEVFTIPEFSLTPHKLIDLEDKSVTPELENISYNDYPTKTFITPKLITTEITSLEDNTCITSEKENLTDVNGPTTEIDVSKDSSIDLVSAITKTIDETPSVPPPATVNSTATESAISQKKETTYIIQLQDLLSHTSVIVDIAILEEEDHVPLNIQLPEPKLTYKSHYTSQSFPPILPPKLSFSENKRDKRDKRLQFTKLEPNQKAS